MDTKTVSITLLVSVDVSADTDHAAEDIARRFVDGMIGDPHAGFIDGWNSVDGSGEVLDVRWDVEGDIDVEARED